ncbi:choline transporter-like protein 3 isoform X3 [Hemitrygon akajei]|uniref:choline transporter-like protein 3 isoform X3 n=1 Tax=Hemitrygon akajei TaxID=2704970 RepID=UPI003BFA030E
MSCCGQYEVTAVDGPHREWRPQIYRRCTDVPWLIVFFLFWVGMVFIAGYAVTVGAAERLIFGYDSYGNICGRKNSPIKGASLSGQDMTSRKYVFFLNTCNMDFTDHKINSLSICVSSCPQEQLNDLEEIKLFAQNNALSFIMVAIFRFIAELLVHIFITLVIFGILFVSGVLWWLYYDNVNDPNIILQTEMENTRALLGFAIVATIITVIVIVLTLVMRKKISLTIQLFRIASKLLRDIPLLLLQPLWTLIILALFWTYWVAVLLSLGTAGNAYVIADNQVEYRSLSGVRYVWWYHLTGLIWTSEFILACQQMTIAGAVVCCYFNRDKTNLPSHPILTSISRLFNYHLGTVVKGSFIITLVRIPQIVLLYVHNSLKGKENTCARCLLKCCQCCLCCWEKWLRYLNQNAYIATAINGTNFCSSAKEAFFLFVSNALSVAAVNCFGDFMLFLGKVFIVCFTVFGGLMIFNYNRDLNVWGVPLILVSFFAYLVAHCFLSVFEMAVDVLFMCYAIDLATNDGSAEKPYFMDKELMKFIGKTNEEITRSSGSDKANRKSNRYVAELQPMDANAT